MTDTEIKALLNEITLHAAECQRIIKLLMENRAKEYRKTREWNPVVLSVNVDREEAEVHLNNAEKIVEYTATVPLASDNWKRRVANINGVKIYELVKVEDK